MARQLVNRLVMLRARGLDGPFMQRIGGGRLVHTAGNFIGSRGGTEFCDWILASGEWDDTGCWDDTAVWHDTCPWLLASGVWNDAGCWDDTQIWSDE